MRQEEEEEDAKSRERRGGTVMGEPHAQQGRQAQTRSSRIANMRQNDTRKIKMMPWRGEDSPHKMRVTLDHGGRAVALATIMPAFEIFSLLRILP